MDISEKARFLRRAARVNNVELATELQRKFRREKRILEHTPKLFRSPSENRRLATLQALNRALSN